MKRLLPLLVLPIAELWLLIELGGVFGAFAVVAWVMAMIALGMWILRRQAIALGGFVRAMQRDGVGPARIELDKPSLFAAAGLLFAFPGVITDVAALTLIIIGLVRGMRRAGPRPYRDAPGRGPDVEVLPPGSVATPFTERPRVIDVE